MWYSKRLFTVGRSLTPLFFVFLFLFCSASTLSAQEETAVTEPSAPFLFPFWFICLFGACAALFFAQKFYRWMISCDEGDEKMIAIAQHVREGADAYLKQQYKVVSLFFILICAILSLLAYGLNTQAAAVPWAFLTGGFYSGLAGWFGMKTATRASSRTTSAAKNSLNSALQIAFRSGAVMGLVVVGLALLDISIWFALLYWGFDLSLSDVTISLLGIGMGASCQALFARVGGGIFTKAADVGADLVGKVEAGIPEDDPRNPATIADNVGDNVGDVAGMGADLYESYCGSILASAALGVAAYSDYPKMAAMMMMLPLVLAACGIGLSIWGVFLVKADEDASQHKLMQSLEKGSNWSSVGVGVVSFVLVTLMLVWPSAYANIPADSPLPSGSGLYGVFGAIVIGLVSGAIIGRWTMYETNEEYAPTQRIAAQSQTGPATIIIAGVAEGFYSVWVPIIVVCAAILLSFGLCTGFNFADATSMSVGLYGVAIAAVGMLSTLGITLATDAYGPIADNAGGNAEMSGQEPIVRERTDALDSLGNTTAAIGKGFAIGSAALTALALLAAYIEQVRNGIDHWVANEEIEIEQTIDLSDAHAVKVGKGILGIQPENSDELTGYLIFSGSRVNSEDLAEISKAETGSVLDVDLATLIASDQAIANKQATIPDFVRFYNANLMNPKVLIGVFMGVMMTFVFCALTMKAVGRSAGDMVEEVRRQFREFKGIMEGETEPDYTACVSISTAAAQREMLIPGLLGILVPIGVGLFLGVTGVMGMLVGGLTSGFAVAIMMANSGGAWDNAKKYIESGAHGGKGSECHKAAVVGDTVGDPFKDTSGPSLNILIKLTSMVSVIAAGSIVQYSLTLF